MAIMSLNLNKPGEGIARAQESQAKISKMQSEMRTLSQERKKRAQDMEHATASEARKEKDQARLDKKAEREAEIELDRKEKFELDQKALKTKTDVTVALGAEMLNSQSTMARKIELSKEMNADQLLIGVQKAELEYRKDNPNALDDQVRSEYFLQSLESQSKATDLTNGIALDVVERFEAGMITLDEFKKSYDPLYDDDEIGSLTEKQLKENLSVIKASLISSKDHLRDVAIEMIKKDSAVATAKIRAIAASAPGGIKKSDYLAMGDMADMVDVGMKMMLGLGDLYDPANDDSVLKANAIGADLAARAMEDWQVDFNAHLGNPGLIPAPAHPTAYMEEQVTKMVGRVDTRGTYHAQDALPAEALYSDKVDVSTLSILEISKREWVRSRMDDAEYRAATSSEDMPDRAVLRSLDLLWADPTTRKKSLNKNNP